MDSSKEFIMSEQPSTTTLVPESIEMAQKPHKTETIDNSQEMALAAAPVTETDDAYSEVKVPLSRTQFGLVYMGLLFAIFLAALDQTIVSTALRSIIQEFGKQELVPWIGSSYMLTAAPMSTLYGKCADIFGRKYVFLFAIVVFEIGSFIAGISTSMEMLIVGRAISGIGGGGIFSLVVIIISDIVSIQDRGKYQGAIGGVFGLSSVFGPLIGGAFSDSGATWRWCFYINLPFGVITVASIVAFLNFPPTEGTFSEKVKRIDFLGTVVLFSAIICLITPLQLGGSLWDWTSTQVSVLLVLSPILFAVFTYVELKVAKEPLIPPTIFVNKSVPALLAAAVALGACFIASVYYIALFFQVILNDSATSSGLETIPLVFGLLLTSVGSGFYISKFGKYKIFFLVGPVILILGCILLSFFNASTSLVIRVFSLIVFGLGNGCLVQTRVLALQASVPHELIAIATAIGTTCYTLGGVIGVSITGTIFNNAIQSSTANDTSLQIAISYLTFHGIPAQASNTLALLKILHVFPGMLPPATPAAVVGQMQQTASEAIQQLLDGFNQAYKIGYLCLIPYPVIVLVLSVFIEQFQMKRKGKEPESRPVGNAASA
ncbi:UNVERIFIED_CONTAM: hypothetical protein HDU68_010029 [Siphonaria sp. JEL0065]|nr:hypothetical protein HDU68_010029 [Siphonaria sp. JEL0065]